MLTNKLRYPDFVCIGSQKAGTTWLEFILRQHPGVWTPQVKEIQYFNQLYISSHRSWIPGHRDEHATGALLEHISKLSCGQRPDWSKISELTAVVRDDVSDEWYGRIFAHANEEQKAGEFTPEYALLPEEGVKHLLRLNPEVKIIFLVRDPIDRAWSHMRMLLSHGMNCASDEELAEWVKLADIRDRCDYSATI